MKYIVFSEIGHALYNSQFNQSIPENAVEINDEIYWRICTEQDGMWSLVGGEIVKLPLPGTLPQPITVFSSLDYLQKFTTDEYAAARNHANVSVQFGLDMLIAAQFVDLSDPRVAMTLDLLVTEGVVPPERRTELLAPKAA